MTQRKTPNIDVTRPAKVHAFEPSGELLEKWDSSIRAAGAQNNVISILDTIGDDMFGDGITARRVSAALRSIKDDEIVVDINSPGGDFFEGVGIYNVLRQDERKVKVRILGLAASAASVVAMAGDEVEIGNAGFIMVHNAWATAMGNRHDMLEAAETLEPFDKAMAAVYASKAGVKKDVAAGWMDAESWFNGQDAVDIGLADTFLSADIEKAEGDKPSALRRIDTALAKQNISRSERRALLNEITSGTPGAATSGTPSAANETAEMLSALMATLRER